MEVPSTTGSTIVIKINPDNDTEPVKTKLTIKACVEETSKFMFILLVLQIDHD